MDIFDDEARIFNRRTTLFIQRYVDAVDGNYQRIFALQITPDDAADGTYEWMGRRSDEAILVTPGLRREAMNGTLLRCEGTTLQKRIPLQCAKVAQIMHVDRQHVVCNNHINGYIYKEHHIVVHRNFHAQFAEDDILFRYGPLHDALTFFVPAVPSPHIDAILSYTRTTQHREPVTCSICLMPQRRMLRLEVCGHEACQACILQWIRSRQGMALCCPFCRRFIMEFLETNLPSS